MSIPETMDPTEYVRENKETLVDIIKHSDDSFVRSLCIAALAEYGEDPDIEEVLEELERFAESEVDE